MGGWATTLTQTTEITPITVAKSILKTAVFLDGYHEYAKQCGYTIAEMHYPIGSARYYADDYVVNKSVLYGDIDMLIVFIENPKIGNENKRLSQNNENILNYIREVEPTIVDVEETLKVSSKNCVKLIIKDNEEGKPEKFIQVDLIPTFVKYSDWALNRYTPVRHLKGFIVGKYYSTLSKFLYFTAGSFGSRMKWRDGKPIANRYRKNTSLELITTDNINLFQKVTEYLIRKFKNLEVDLSNRFNGFVSSDQKLGDLFKESKIMILELESHGILKQITKYDSTTLIKKIKSDYCKSVDSMLDSTKFNKANGEICKYHMSSIKRSISFAKEIINYEL